MDDLADRLIQILLHWRTRYLAAWFVALVVASAVLYNAWTTYDNAKRGDGNAGHTFIDFGGQWMMGAMLVQGHGQQLYNRAYQREIATAAFPRGDEVPEADREAKDRNVHDADDLMTALMGHDDRNSIASMVVPLAAENSLDLAGIAVCGQPEWKPHRLRDAVADRGGPLYPPINALIYYPLALLRPQTAYRTMQVLGIVLAGLAGLGLSRLSHGRVWWPLALVFVLLYPGFGPSVKLGQNAFLTLNILVWGWVLIARGRPGWGGVVWGLLAFKPVWAAAFFLVPLLTRRWGTCVAMVMTGTAIAASTLAFVGMHSWLDWLKIGRDAAALYNVDENWIFLSRDLLSIPRRWMLDFQIPLGQRDRFPPALVGWCIVVFVLEVTVRLVFLRRHQVRALAGPAAAFFLLGAWMSCFHFMYYDVLLTALPVFLLITEPRRYLEPIFLAIMPVSAKGLREEMIDYFQPGWLGDYPPPVPFLEAHARYLWVWNRFVPTFLFVLLVVEHLFPTLDAALTARVGMLSPQLVMVSSAIYIGGHPWDTYCLIVLWLWCGWQWLKQGGKMNRDENLAAFVPASDQLTTLESLQRVTSPVHPT